MFIGKLPPLGVPVQHGAVRTGKSERVVIVGGARAGVVPAASSVGLSLCRRGACDCAGPPHVGRRAYGDRSTAFEGQGTGSEGQSGSLEPALAQ